MNKILLTALTVLLMISIAACGEVTPPTQPDETRQTSIPTQTQCDHYDMDVDNLCDECGESLLQETQPTPSQTQPDHRTAVLRLYVEYTLGAYSSGTTTMMLYDSNVATVDSVVDTSAVGQGHQHISETGTWQYDAESDRYTVTFGRTQYILEKNADGLFFTQYSFTMKGQTGGHQDISVVPVETN